MVSEADSLFVLQKHEEGVLQICLNRPEKKNAINRSMYRDMVEMLQAAEADTSVRVVLLSGLGPCFTSGNDLVDFAEASRAGAPRLPKPVAL